MHASIFTELAVIVTVVVLNSTSNEQPTANESTDQSAQAAPPPLPGENPEIKSPIQPPAPADRSSQ